MSGGAEPLERQVILNGFYRALKSITILPVFNRARETKHCLAKPIQKVYHGRVKSITHDRDGDFIFENR